MTTRELFTSSIHRGRKEHDPRRAEAVRHPAVVLSHCVMNIEQQLGTRLFTRTSGGLVLTYAGEKVLPHGLRSAARLCGV